VVLSDYGNEAPSAKDRAVTDDAPKPIALNLSGAEIQAVDLERRLREFFLPGASRPPGAIALDGATVVGDLDLSDLRLTRPFWVRDATFTGRAGFGNCTFDGAVDFAGSRFAGPASFAHARFAFSTDWTDAEFGDAAIFTRARFAQDATFRRARFGGSARFRSAVFETAGSFEEAAFAAVADFSGAHWKMAEAEEPRPKVVADFRRARFEGPLRLDGTIAPKAVKFSGAAGVERPSFTDEVGLDKRELRRSFWVTARPGGPGTSGETNDGAKPSLSWDSAVQAVQLIGAVAALVAWVVLIGGAVMYARLAAAQAPNPIRTVTLLPRDALLAQGLHTLAVPLLGSMFLAVVVYLSLTLPKLNEWVRALAARANGWRTRPIAWLTIAVVAVAALVYVLVITDVAFLRVVFALMLAVAIVALASLAIGESRSAIATASIVFTTAMAVSGVLGYVIARWQEPKFEPVSVYLKDSRTLAGFLVGRTETRIGVLCGDVHHRRIAIVAAADAEYVSVGVGQKLGHGDIAQCGMPSERKKYEPEPDPDTRPVPDTFLPPDDRQGVGEQPVDDQGGTQAVRVKIDPLKVDPVKVGAVKVDPIEVGTMKVDPLKVDPLRVGAMKVGTMKVDPVKVDAVKVGPVKVGGGRGGGSGNGSVKVVRVPEVRETHDRVRVVTVPAGTTPGPVVHPPSGGRPSRNPMRADRRGFYLFGTYPFSAPVSGVVQLVTAHAVGGRQVRLGTKAFRSSGTGVLVRFRLSPSMRRELRHRNAIAVRARLTVRGRDGGEVTHIYDNLPIRPR
jgi:uncharacterized protein YjbI with pentapeptide repeats